MVFQPSLWLAGASLALPLVVSPLDGSVLRPRSEVGQRIRRTVSFETEMKLVRVRQEQNGEVLTDGASSGFRRKASTRRVFSAIDDVEAAEDGVASKFLRTFEGMKGHTRLLEVMDADPEWGQPGSKFEIDSGLKSPLEDLAVRFERDRDQWTRTLPEGSPLREEQVSSLSADLSLSCLLPQESVRRGRRWDVDASCMRELLALGGDLGFEQVEEAEDGEFSAMMTRVPMDPAKTEWSGEITFVHKGKAKRGSRRLAIEIKVDVKGTNEAKFEQAGFAGQTAPSSPFGDNELTTSYDLSYSGKGRLEWDPELCQVVELSLELEVEEIATESNSMTMPGMGKLELETTETSEGRVHLGFEAKSLRTR